MTADMASLFAIVAFAGVVIYMMERYRQRNEPPKKDS